jgi:ABC-type Mn2+/Zn2+ transport system permease subunit
MQNGFQTHTPPAYAAATTGLMTGLSAGTSSPIISPATVIRGIASAGVGLATANIAGRALSAMAGLTPEGQHKLQDMGLWGGMMHAIVPAMMGFR